MFSSLSTNDKIRFLSRLGWELTVTGRDSYEPQTEELTHPGRLRAINEIQHRILDHVYSLASEISERYPDDVLIAIILEESGDRTLNEQVQYAFDRAAEFLDKNPS
jgi:hypothetical protein